MTDTTTTAAEQITSFTLTFGDITIDLVRNGADAWVLTGHTTPTYPDQYWGAHAPTEPLARHRAAILATHIVPLRQLQQAIEEQEVALRTLISSWQEDDWANDMGEEEPF